LKTVREKLEVSTAQKSQLTDTVSTQKIQIGRFQKQEKLLNVIIWLILGFGR
jgi:hypothetical protein